MVRRTEGQGDSTSITFGSESLADVLWTKVRRPWLAIHLRLRHFWTGYNYGFYDHASEDLNNWESKKVFDNHQVLSFRCNQICQFQTFVMDVWEGRDATSFGCARWRRLHRLQAFTICLMSLETSGQNTAKYINVSCLQGQDKVPRRRYPWRCIRLNSPRRSNRLLRWWLILCNRFVTFRSVGVVCVLEQDCDTSRLGINPICGSSL